MDLRESEKEMLSGKNGPTKKKAMEILVALGKIFGAKKLIPVKSVQVAGVSYHNLGNAGLEFLESLAVDGSKVKVFSTLNPAGMDLENYQALGISEEFAEKQRKVIDSFSKMGVQTSCTCTPYLIGNRPIKGDHISWGESSAVCFANSVLGAYTNREGGPSALASALTGVTPEFGMHLDENRQAKILVDVKCSLDNEIEIAALGHAISTKTKKMIPLIQGIEKITEDKLKLFSASIATYLGVPMFHMKGFTLNDTITPENKIEINREDIESSIKFLNDFEEVDFIGIGCPHCSIDELKKINEYLESKNVKKEFWICVSRKVKNEAQKKGYLNNIISSGAKLACDTCMAVAPLKGRFKCMATNSAKACYYGRGSNNFKTKLMNLEDCVRVAVGEQ